MNENGLTEQELEALRLCDADRVWSGRDDSPAYRQYRDVVAGLVQRGLVMGVQDDCCHMNYWPTKVGKVALKEVVDG